MALKTIGGSFPVSCQVAAASASTDYFEQVNNGLSVTDRIGWLLQMVEDFTDPAAAALNAEGDGIVYGLCLTNAVKFANVGITGLMDAPQYKWFSQLTRHDFGTAATGEISRFPRVFDFRNLSDGGILMVPQPLYAFASNNGGVSASITIRFRAWFQAVQLSDADYFNMLQANQILTA